jgi:hypothetical protein
MFAPEEMKDDILGNGCVLDEAQGGGTPNMISATCSR